MSKATIYLSDRGQGKVALSGTLRNQFKREHDIQSMLIDNRPRDTASPPAPPFLEAERPEVMAILNAMAETAWENGWRPRGLTGTVAGLISGYKLPPEEGPTDQRRSKR